MDKVYLLNILKKLNAHKTNFKDVLSVTITNTFQKFVAFIIPIIIIGKLGEDIFGQFGFVMNSMAAVSSCFIVPFTASVSRFLSIAKNQNEEDLLYGEILLKILAILLVIIIGYFVFIWFNPLHIQAIADLKKAHLLGLIYIVFILLVSFFNGLLLVKKSFRLYNSALLIGVAFQLICIYYASAWFGLTGVVVVYGLYNIIQFAVIYLKIQKKYKFNIIHRIKLYVQNINNSHGIILNFILPNSLAYALMMLASWWGNVKLISFLGYTEVGFISVLMQLQIIIAFVPNILNTVLLPRLSKKFIENKLHFFGIFKKYILFVFFITFIGSGLFYLFAKPVLQIYSNTYAGLYQVLQIFCIAYILNVLIGLINQIILSSDNIWWTFVLNLSWVIPFIYFLEPNLIKKGLYGYAIVYNTAYGFQFAIALIYLLLYLKKHKLIFMEVKHVA